MYVMEKNKLSNPFRMYDKGDDVGEEEKSYSFVNGVMKN
jgi:hypothetical protein